MRYLKRLDMHKLSLSVTRSGGQTFGYGFLIGGTFIGIVRMGLKMRRARRKHVR